MFQHSGSFSDAFGIYTTLMSLPLFEVRRLLSHGGARIIGIVRTMCHVITEVTANHRLSSRTVHILPVR